MRKWENWKKYYWFFVFTLFLLPMSNSFFINLKKLVKSVITYKDYKSLLLDLSTENNKLSNKVEYYKTLPGIKSLIKEKLNKVEDGELIIKFNQEDKN